MALINCPECNKEISDKAKKCPHCGFLVNNMITCPECNRSIDKTNESCPHCGYPLKNSNQFNLSVDLKKYVQSVYVKIKRSTLITVNNFRSTCKNFIKNKKAEKQSNTSVATIESDAITYNDSDMTVPTPKKRPFITKFIVGFRNDIKWHKVFMTIYYILCSLFALLFLYKNYHIEYILTVIGRFLLLAAIPYGIVWIYDIIRYRRFVSAIIFPIIAAVFIIGSQFLPVVSEYWRLQTVGFPVTPKEIISSIETSYKNQELKNLFPDTAALSGNLCDRVAQNANDRYFLTTYEDTSLSQTISIVSNRRFDGSYAMNVHCIAGKDNKVEDDFWLYSLYGFMKCIDNAYTPERFYNDLSECISSAKNNESHYSATRVNNALFIELTLTEYEVVLNTYRIGYNVSSIYENFPSDAQRFDTQLTSTPPPTITASPLPTPESTPEPTNAPTTVPTSEPTEKPTQEDTFIRENYGYVDYKSLARNPDEYLGKSLTYSGRVIQVIEGDDITQLRIAVNSDYDSVVLVSYPKDMVVSRILDDDYVTIFGTSFGLYTYEATSGASITIPWIYLDRIELN